MAEIETTGMSFRLVCAYLPKYPPSTGSMMPHT